jgi:hypothetical protein
VYATLQALHDPTQWSGLAEQLQQLDSLTQPSARQPGSGCSTTRVPQPGIVCQPDLVPFA